MNDFGNVSEWEGDYLENSCGVKSIAGSTPAVSAKEELKSRGILIVDTDAGGKISSRQDIWRAEIVIIDGIITKNRYGGPGRDIRGLIYVFDEYPIEGRVVVVCDEKLK